MRRLVVAVLAVFIFAACPHNGEEIPFDAPRPDKIPPFKVGTKLEMPLRVALYVDTSKPNTRDVLKSAALYSVLPGEKQTLYKMTERRQQTKVAYFDYVILGGGKLKKGKYSAYLELSKELQSILEDYHGVIKPLQEQGIKVLLGISGGDGISFGSLQGDFEEDFIDDYRRFFISSGGVPLSADEFLEDSNVINKVNAIFKERIKNKEFFSQSAFAKQVISACKFFRLNGVEFWDKGVISQPDSPYPEIGKSFFNGETLVPITSREDEVYNWIKGGGNFADLLTYITIYLGTSATFQGELRGDVYEHPILVRESRFGQWLTKEVPRYAFSSTMLAMTYVASDTRDQLGFTGDGHLNRLMEDWVEIANYSPIILDFAAIDDPKFDEKLEKYSIELGELDMLGDGSLIYPFCSPYGLVYYDNLGPHTDEQLRRLSITSFRLFDADVKYGAWKK